MKLGTLIGGIMSTTVVAMIAVVAVVVLLVSKGCQFVEDNGGVKQTVIEVGKDVREIAEEITDTTETE